MLLLPPAAIVIDFVILISVPNNEVEILSAACATVISIVSPTYEHGPRNRWCNRGTCHPPTFLKRQKVPFLSMKSAPTEEKRNPILKQSVTHQLMPCCLDLQIKR